MKHLLWLAVLSIGCGSDPVDAEGTYSIAITNRDNGCNFNNWTVGNTASNIEVVITQNGEAVIADVNGGGGFVLDVSLGGSVFSGSVDGDALDLELQGTRSNTTGNCTFTYNADMLATLTGDILVGRLNYRSAHNNNSDCAAITCLSYQDFNGTRPPR